MVKKLRKEVLFGVGLLVGVAAGAVGMMSLKGGDGPYATSPPTRAMGAAPASTAFVTAVSVHCEMAPILPSAGDGDGRAVLQTKTDAATADEVGSLILAGKEAAASGHRRDAEVAFLNACRNAAALTDGDPIPLADAMYQLGRHYATVGALAGVGKSKELFQRSERLYSASVEAYRARYGDDHEKTKFAQAGLETVLQATGGKAPAAIAKVQPQAAPAQPAPEPAPVAAAPAPAPDPTPAAAPAAAPAPVAAAPAPAPAPEPKAKPATKPAEPPAVAKAAEPRAAAKPPEPKVMEPRAVEAEPAPVAAAPRPRPAPRPRVEPEAPPAPVIAAEPQPQPQPQRRPAPIVTDNNDTGAPTASGSTGMGGPPASSGGSADESY